MTIQEAIKSGKPYRRTNEFSVPHRWVKGLGGLTGHIIFLDSKMSEVGLCEADILATDWEIKSTDNQQGKESEG